MAESTGAPGGAPLRNEARFDELGPGPVALFLAAVGDATLSTLLIVAPVTAHRLLFRHHAKAGLVCLGITVTLVADLVFGFVLGPPAVAWAGGVGAAALLGLWLALPLWLRRRSSTDARYA